MALHGLQQHERRGEVVAVVFERVSDRLAHISKGGEVQHSLGLVLRKHTLHQTGVRHVALDERHARRGQRLAVAEDEVVEHHHALAAFMQARHCVRADVARAARHQECAFCFRHARLYTGKAPRANAAR